MRTAGLLAFLLGILVSPVAAHDWYTPLRDWAGNPCCNAQDCRPVAFCRCRAGQQCLLVDGRCMPIPWDRVLPIVSPDGGAHACWPDDPDTPGSTVPVPLCIILPGTS